MEIIFLYLMLGLNALELCTVYCILYVVGKTGLIKLIQIVKFKY